MRLVTELFPFNFQHDKDYGWSLWLSMWTLSEREKVYEYLFHHILFISISNKEFTFGRGSRYGFRFIHNTCTTVSESLKWNTFSAMKLKEWNWNRSWTVWCGTAIYSLEVFKARWRGGEDWGKGWQGAVSPWGTTSLSRYILETDEEDTKQEMESTARMCLLERAGGVCMYIRNVCNYAL